MLLATLTWSIFSSAALVDDLEPPPWPEGMHATRSEGGVLLLNRVAADAVHLHLEWCERVPELARSIGDSRVSEALAIGSELHAVELAGKDDHIAQLKRERWSPLQRVGAVLSGGIVGVAIGIIVGWQVSR